MVFLVNSGSIMAGVGKVVTTNGCEGYFGDDGNIQDSTMVTVVQLWLIHCFVHLMSGLHGM